MTASAPNFYVVDFLMGLPTGVLDALADSDSAFGRMIYREAMPVRLENSGKRAVVAIDTPGGHYSGSSAYGNVVNIRLYADHTRDIDGKASVDDGVDRAWAMFGLIDKYLNASHPIKVGDPFVQSERVNQPLETFDAEQNVPFVSVSYDIAILVTT